MSDFPKRPLSTLANFTETVWVGWEESAIISGMTRTRLGATRITQLDQLVERDRFGAMISIFVRTRKAGNGCENRIHVHRKCRVVELWNWSLIGVLFMWDVPNF